MNLTEFIIAITVVLFVLGIGVAAWSLIDTRKRYYYEYKQRKGR